MPTSTPTRAQADGPTSPDARRTPDDAEAATAPAHDEVAVARRRRWPAVAALAAGALLLGIGLLRGAPEVEAHGTSAWHPVAAPAAPSLVTHPLKVRAGGYVVRVPEGTRATVKGSVARVRATDGSLLLTVAPTGRTADPALGNARVLTAMQRTYATLRQGSHQRQTVGGRPAVASYGTVTTKQGTTLRYVVISIAGAKRGWAIAAFTRGDSDAGQVLPLVRAVVNGFRPLA